MFCGRFDLVSKHFVYLFRIIRIQFEVFKLIRNLISKVEKVLSIILFFNFFQRNAKTGYSSKDDRLDLLMRKADLGDWFLIFLLSKNLDSILFREFISQLTEKLKTEP